MLNDHCHRVSTHLQSINIIIIIINIIIIIIRRRRRTTTTTVGSLSTSSHN